MIIDNLMICGQIFDPLAAWRSLGSLGYDLLEYISIMYAISIYLDLIQGEPSCF